MPVQGRTQLRVYAEISVPEYRYGLPGSVGLFLQVFCVIMTAVYSGTIYNIVEKSKLANKESTDHNMNSTASSKSRSTRETVPKVDDSEGVTSLLVVFPPTTLPIKVISFLKATEGRSADSEIQVEKDQISIKGNGD